MLQVYLKKDRELPVQRVIPGFFPVPSKALKGSPDVAGVADIFDAKKNWLARGLYNQKSQIRVRVLTWQQETIDGDFFARRFQQAFALRQRHLSASTNAYRVANGEGDFLPGLIVDRYDDFLVCQFFAAGMATFQRRYRGSSERIRRLQGDI